MLTMDNFVFRGFNLIYLTSRDISGRACCGVSVLIRDGIPYSEYTPHNSTRESSLHIHV